MISYICREKELRQKELMKMMSVTESDIGWSWFVSYLVVYLVVATLCAMVSTQLYTNSAPLLLWIFWVFTFVALIVFSMVISSISAKTTRVRSPSQKRRRPKKIKGNSSTTPEDAFSIKIDQ